MWRELCARGYSGSASKIKPSVAMLRQVPADLLPEGFSQPIPAPVPEETFSVRPLLGVVLMRPEERTEQQRLDLARLSAFSAQVAMGLALAQDFTAMLRDRQVQAFANWLEKAEQCPVRELR